MSRSWLRSALRDWTLNGLMSTTLLLLLAGTVSAMRDDNDTLYILLDDANVFACQGVQNKLSVAKDDITIRNEHGNAVNYIKAPGSYSIHFKRIGVNKNLKHLSGEISASLQVPVFQGPAGIRFDLPYQIIPETGLINQKCDSKSGIIERNKRTYCRYCDLCGTSAEVESTLNRQKFLPGVTRGEEDKFSPVCGRIESDTYEFKRTIKLPGRKELEGRVRSQFEGINGEIKKRLNKGRGRFQVFLNLLTSNKPRITQDQYYQRQQSCRCCAPGARERDFTCQLVGFLYCNVEDCKSAYAAQCLPEDAAADFVACFSVEFNYKMTFDYAEVQSFLRSRGISESQIKPEVHTQQPRPTTRRPTRISPGSSSGTTSNKRHLQSRCVSEITSRMPHLKRYCTIFWNEPLCCKHCQSVC